ncbi:hypothetical protein WN48_10345 [Eufriesea mexicana]|nr:hypothetical protein WN48_10345 [Eufriesea mexicana]
MANLQARSGSWDLATALFALYLRNDQSEPKVTPETQLQPPDRLNFTCHFSRLTHPASGLRGSIQTRATLGSELRKSGKGREKMVAWKRVQWPPPGREALVKNPVKYLHGRISLGVDAVVELLRRITGAEMVVTDAAVA